MIVAESCKIHDFYDVDRNINNEQRIMLVVSFIINRVLIKQVLLNPEGCVGRQLPENVTKYVTLINGA